MEVLLSGGEESCAVFRAWEDGLGFSIAVGLGISAIAAVLESFDSPVSMEETARTYGVTQTSVGEFARARSRAFGGSGR